MEGLEEVEKVPEQSKKAPEQVYQPEKAPEQAYRLLGQRELSSMRQTRA